MPDFVRGLNRYHSKPRISSIKTTEDTNLHRKHSLDNAMRVHRSGKFRQVYTHDTALTIGRHGGRDSCVVFISETGKDRQKVGFYNHRHHSHFDFIPTSTYSLGPQLCSQYTEHQPATKPSSNPPQPRLKRANQSTNLFFIALDRTVRLRSGLRLRPDALGSRVRNQTWKQCFDSREIDGVVVWESWGGIGSGLGSRSRPGGCGEEGDGGGGEVQSGCLAWDVIGVRGICCCWLRCLL